MRKIKPAAAGQLLLDEALISLKVYEPQYHGVPIRELPQVETPAWRLGHYGADALSSGELLAVLLGLESVADGQVLITHVGGANGLPRAQWSELVQLPGIGPGRVAKLQAALELGKRALRPDSADKQQVRSPADAANLLLADMGPLEQEHLRVVLCDSKNYIIKIPTVYVGSLNTAVVRVGEIFKDAIRLNAAALIVAHNHPSGDPTPSPEDVHVTRQIVEAGKLLNIDVLDHLVIGQGRWVSLKERGLGF